MEYCRDDSHLVVDQVESLSRILSTGDLGIVFVCIDVAFKPVAPLHKKGAKSLSTLPRATLVSGVRGQWKLDELH